MDDAFGPALVLVLAGLVGGVVLFVRGLLAYRHDRLISSVATSMIEGMAAGEVRVSGVIEAIDQTLVSPLQSRPCVWYRARIEETGKGARVLLDDERSQAFRLRDATGTIRIVPPGARWQIGPVFDESTSLTGAEPPGLRRRSGPVYAMAERDPDQMTEVEREAAKQALLTVQRPMPADPADGWGAPSGSPSLGFSMGTGLTGRGRRYREARLEPGQTVTILGQAWPWAEVRDHVEAWRPHDNIEQVMAADIAVARELGILAASPEEAWGNAAIPGFGIGKPTVAPDLHPDAHQPEPEGTVAHEAAIARYDIPAEELVLSRGLDGALVVYAGTPEAAKQHHDWDFLVGLIGAIMAVLCALGLGAILTGTL